MNQGEDGIDKSLENNSDHTNELHSAIHKSLEKYAKQSDELKNKGADMENNILAQYSSKLSESSAAENDIANIESEYDDVADKIEPEDIKVISDAANVDVISEAENTEENNIISDNSEFDDIDLDFSSFDDKASESKNNESNEYNDIVFDLYDGDFEHDDEEDHSAMEILTDDIHDEDIEDLDIDFSTDFKSNTTNIAVDDNHDDYHNTESDVNPFTSIDDAHEDGNQSSEHEDGNADDDIKPKAQPKKYRKTISVFVIIALAIGAFLVWKPSISSEKFSSLLGSDKIRVVSAQNAKISYFPSKSLFADDTSLEITLDNAVIILKAKSVSIDAGIGGLFFSSTNKTKLVFNSPDITVTTKCDTSIISLLMSLRKLDDTAFGKIEINGGTLTINNGTKSIVHISNIDLTSKTTGTLNAIQGAFAINDTKYSMAYKHQDAPLEHGSQDNTRFSLKSSESEFSLSGNMTNIGSFEYSIKGIIALNIKNMKQFLANISDFDAKIINIIPEFGEIAISGPVEYDSVANIFSAQDQNIRIFGHAGIGNVSKDSDNRYKMAINFDDITYNAIVDGGNKIAQSAGDIFDIKTIFGKISFNLAINIKKFLINTTSNVSLSDIALNVKIEDGKLMLQPSKFMFGKDTSFNVSGQIDKFLTKANSGNIKFTFDAKNEDVEYFKYFILNTLNLKYSGDANLMTYGGSGNFLFQDTSVFLDGLSMKINDVKVMKSMQTRMNQDGTYYKMSDTSYENLDMNDLKFIPNVLLTKQTDIYPIFFQNITDGFEVETSIKCSKCIVGGTAMDQFVFNYSLDGGIISGDFSASSGPDFKTSAVFDMDVTAKTPNLFLSVDTTNLDFRSVDFMPSDIFDGSVSLPIFNRVSGQIIFNADNIRMDHYLISNAKFTGNIKDGALDVSNFLLSAKDSESGQDCQMQALAKINLSTPIPKYAFSYSISGFDSNDILDFFGLTKNIPLNGMVNLTGKTSFSGSSMPEWLKQMDFKLSGSIYDIIIPQMDLNSVSATFLDVNPDKINALFKQDIETQIKTGQNGVYNIDFTLSGNNKQINFGDCNIKSEAVSGSCAGTASINDNNQIDYDILAKNSLLVRDINNKLVGTMPIYTSHKISVHGDKKTYDTDFSQIYQYLNFRKASFGR